MKKKPAIIFLALLWGVFLLSKVISIRSQDIIPSNYTIDYPLIILCVGMFSFPLAMLQRAIKRKGGVLLLFSIMFCALGIMFLSDKPNPFSLGYTILFTLSVIEFLRPHKHQDVAPWPRWRREYLAWIGCAVIAINLVVVPVTVSRWHDNARANPSFIESSSALKWLWSYEPISSEGIYEVKQDIIWARWIPGFFLGTALIWVGYRFKSTPYTPPLKSKLNKQEFVEADIIEQKIASCLVCGSKNRFYRRGQNGVYRCGSCSALMPNPFSFYSKVFPKKRPPSFGEIVTAILLFAGIIAVGVLINKPEKNKTTMPTLPAFAYNYVPAMPTPDSLLAQAQKLVVSNRNIEPIEQIRPLNGEVINNTGGKGVAPLEIRSEEGDDYLVKLVHDITPWDNILIFVKGGSTVNTLVPTGFYTLKYASGSKWYGYKLLFGDDTHYTKAERGLTFFQKPDGYAGHTLTLYSVPDGNLTVSKIRPNEF